MAPDERSRVEASQALSDQLGPAAAAALMECIPPFGWHEIATKRDLAVLERRFDAMERRFDVMERRFDAVERRLVGLDGLEERFDLRLDARLHAEMNRMIRWTVASIFGGLTVLCAAATAVAAVLS